MIHRRLMRHAVAALAVGMMGLSCGACAVNPATGKRQFDMLSREEEIALGDEAKAELASQYGGPVQDAALQAYVTEVGMDLAQRSEEPYRDLPWEFTLLDSDVINAFALPGGKVYITRGLASRLSNEAQLAGVLGHEVGHVTAEHADKRISNQMILAGIVVGAAVAAGQSDDDWIAAGVPLLVGAGGQGFLLKFGRDEETEADRLGMRYMVRADYNPQGQLQVMQVLAEASKGPRPIELLSTHPYPETRIERIRDLLSKDYYRVMHDPMYKLKQAEYEERMLGPLRRLAEARGGDAPSPHAAGAGGRMNPAWARFGGAGHWCPQCGGDMPGDAAR